MKPYNPEEDLTAILMEKLTRIERGINAIKLGGIFVLLVVSFDYLANLGWFGPEVQRFTGR
ncbi:MAG TPA: hypothetical protein VEZ16_02830 [Microvirga sp.]|nr:hypothetical protein [Microvirga sp.]